MNAINEIKINNWYSVEEISGYFGWSESETQKNLGCVPTNKGWEISGLSIKAYEWKLERKARNAADIRPT